MTESINTNAQKTDSQGVDQQAGKNLQLVQPAAIETVRVPTAPGDTYAIQFDPSNAQVAIEGKDLVLSFVDGGRLVFVGLVDAAAASNEPQFLIGGVEIGSTALLGQALALAGETTLETAAAGSVQSGGGSVYSDGAGEALNLLDGADVLGETELLFRTIETTNDDPTLAENGDGGAPPLEGVAYTVGGAEVGSNASKSATFLYKIDLATGETTQVGLVSDDKIDIEGLALNPVDGMLYGAATKVDPGLVIIDPATGASTFFSVDPDLWRLVEGMAFDPMGNLFVITDAPDLGFYSVDLTVGNEGGLTRLGDLSIDPDQKVEGISVDPVTGNVFILAGEDGVDTTLYQIDPADGSLIAFFPVTAGGTPVTELEGLSFDADGTLWALQSDGGGVFVINPETGAATFVSDSLGLGEVTDNFESLAVQWSGMEQVVLPRIEGTGGDDVLLGTTMNDNLRGNSGNDLIKGGFGNDRILGNDGDDEIHGGEGNDLLGGQNGNDLILGGGGNDTIFGGAGVDELHGGAGDDTIWGRDGDTVLPGTGSNRLFDDGGKNTVVYKFGDVEADAIDELLFFQFGNGHNPATSENGDRIDISDILTGAGYDPIGDALEDFVQVTSTGTGDTIVSVSLAGDGTNFVDIAQIVGRDVSLGDLLTNDNLVTV